MFVLDEHEEGGPIEVAFLVIICSASICAVGMHRECTGPISTYSFIGSQVNTTPRRLNTLRSTSESITVECT